MRKQDKKNRMKKKVGRNLFLRQFCGDSLRGAGMS
jgi:hypothetical protein